MAIVSVEEGWPDAGGFLGSMLRTRSIPSGTLDPLKANYARFSDPSFEKAFRQASRRSGRSRWAAFARLESDVLRRAAPVAPLYYQNDIVFVSARVGCVTYNPTLTIDLAAFCLR